MAVQGFAGVDYSTKDRSSGPVQFERDPAEAVEADPFGLDQIISEVSCIFFLCGPTSASRAFMAAICPLGGVDDGPR